MSEQNKYLDLWSDKRNLIKEKLKIAQNLQSIQLSSSEFKTVGNRKDYSFNLEFENGRVKNDISGSAVARDLAKVLEGAPDVKAVLNSGHFKINMDKNFCLWIQKLWIIHPIKFYLNEGITEYKLEWEHEIKFLLNNQSGLLVIQG